MSKKVHLTVACNTYDRIRPIIDGSVEIEGCDINFIAIPPEEAHARAFNGADFDVTELSFSSHIVATSRGVSPYVGLPAFISRCFRHSCIYIRTDRGISRPEDLKGKVIGVPEYQMTAAVWVRGILEDDHGVASSEVAWRTGGLNQKGRKERMPLNLPAKFDVKPIGDHISLSDALKKGEIDALVTAREPDCFNDGTPGIARLFPDYRAAEEDYFARTGIFPIIHLIGLRRDLSERFPWLARSVYKAFLRSKLIAQRNLLEMGFLHTSHPWIADDVRRAQEKMGDDLWPYGIDRNAAAISTLLRYEQEQGLVDRPLSIEEVVNTRVSDALIAI